MCNGEMSDDFKIFILIHKRKHKLDDIQKLNESFQNSGNEFNNDSQPFLIQQSMNLNYSPAS
jgi:hypothetical protein